MIWSYLDVIRNLCSVLRCVSQAMTGSRVVFSCLRPKQNWKKNNELQPAKWTKSNEKFRRIFRVFFVFMEIYFNIASLTCWLYWSNEYVVCAYAYGFTLVAFHSGIPYKRVEIYWTMTAYPSKLAKQKHAFTTIKWKKILKRKKPGLLVRWLST